MTVYEWPSCNQGAWQWVFVRGCDLRGAGFVLHVILIFLKWTYKEYAWEHHIHVMGWSPLGTDTWNTLPASKKPLAN